MRKTKCVLWFLAVLSSVSVVSAAEIVSIDQTDPITDVRMVGHMSESVDGKGGLVVRCDGPNLQVIVFTGEFVGGDESKVFLRFDGGTAKTESWVVAVNNKGVFSREPAAFVRAMLSSSRLVVRVVAYDEEATTRVFLLSDLNAEASKLACVPR